VRHLEVTSGATHRFEQPGALEQVAQLACAWFTRYLLVAEERDALQPPADLDAMAAR
jgi:putative phosphoribosyl transferase